MRKKGFFNKLMKEGRLTLVEPSEEVSGAYLKKSESNLISSKTLLKNNRFEEAVSLAYYSMYHMTQALFFKTGIKCGNHTATIILLKKIFDIDAKELSENLGKLMFPGWITQPTARKKIEREFRRFLRRYIKRYGVTLQELESIYSEFIENVKNYGTTS